MQPLTAEQARARPRVVLSFHQKKDSLRLSGLLVGGEELAGRPAVLRCSRGAGARRCCLQSDRSGVGDTGSVRLVFNTILNWNELRSGAWPAAPKPTGRPSCGPDERALGFS